MRCAGSWGLDFALEQIPDATTLLHFRHLLEEHNLGERLFEAQNQIFEAEGWIMRGGSIVDATIIAAPSSTKNAGGARDPEMHCRTRRRTVIAQVGVGEPARQSTESRAWTRGSVNRIPGTR
jgi:IS5 family transposase